MLQLERLVNPQTATMQRFSTWEMQRQYSLWVIKLDYCAAAPLHYSCLIPRAITPCPYK